MNDFLISMAITTLLELVKQVIPNNGTAKSKWKKALLKVFKAIGEAYKNDEDFKTAV